MARKKREPTCADLTKALEGYRKAEAAIDDLLFARLGGRIQQQGYVGPDDLYLIALWKSVPAEALKHARGALLMNTPKEIEDTSRRALSLVEHDSSTDAAVEAVRELDELHHMGIPIASTILTLFDPTRFGAVDPSAWKTLGWPYDRDEWEPEDYGRYLVRIREMAEKCGLTPREVEAALHWIGSK